MSDSTPSPGIVVGVDGSSSSMAAVRWATFEARMRNVPLTLVHVEVTAAWGPAPWLLADVPLPPAGEDPQREVPCRDGNRRRGLRGLLSHRMTLHSSLT